jgi:hypothetical protein
MSAGLAARLCRFTAACLIPGPPIDIRELRDEVETGIRDCLLLAMARLKIESERLVCKYCGVHEYPNWEKFATPLSVQTEKYHVLAAASAASPRPVQVRSTPLNLR